MSVHKRKNRSGEIVWAYRFDPPDSTKAHRHEIRMSGFATKNEAINAEAARRLEVKKNTRRQRRELRVSLEPLAHLLEEFFEQHGMDLAPKTMERYREMAKYLSPQVLTLSLDAMTPLRFAPEWERLSREGGHTRRDKTPRRCHPRACAILLVW